MGEKPKMLTKEQYACFEEMDAALSQCKGMDARIVCMLGIMVAQNWLIMDMLDDIRKQRPNA